MCLHENDTSDYHRVCRGCGLGSALHVWQKSISFTLVLQSHKSVPLAEHNQRRSPDLGADSDDEQQAHSKAGNGTKSCHDASTRWLHCCIWPGISRVPHLHVLRSFGVPNGGRLFVVSATIKGSIIIAEHHREFVGMGKPRKRSRGTDRPDSGWKPEGPGIALPVTPMAVPWECTAAASKATVPISGTRNFSFKGLPGSLLALCGEGRRGGGQLLARTQHVQCVHVCCLARQQT
jgi:hypothetical protein